MHYNKMTFLAITFFVIGLTGLQAQTVKDIDGNVYNTLTIGTQIWMAEDLKVFHYRNGDTISYVYIESYWAALNTGAYCYYDGWSGSRVRLYNWFAVNDSRGLAPVGWHIPSDAEWKTLINFVDSTDFREDKTGDRDVFPGGKLKETGVYNWHSPNTNATNESGFTALPGGLRLENGSYQYIGKHGSWWSSTIFDDNNARYVSMNYNDDYIDRHHRNKKCGFSVRCIKD